MKILVLAHPKDDHAAPIRWALEQAGYRAACWSGISWAEQDQASLLLDSSPVASLGAIRLEEDDVVWLRQPPHDSATGTSGKTSPAFPVFWDDIACTLETLPLRCINKFSASCLIRNKGVQLYLARASGLTVP